MKNKLLAKKLVENSKDGVALVNSKALLKLNESISDIYEAKCKDLKIPITKSQNERFREYWFNKCINGVVNFDSAGFGVNFAQELASSIMSNDGIRKIVLSKNMLGDEGVFELFKAIKFSKSVFYIDISSNWINPRGTKAIFQNLKNNESVYSLCMCTMKGINRNIIGLQGSISLSKCLSVNKTLSILDISSNSIKNEEIEILVEGLTNNKTLLSLNISNNKFDFQVMEKFGQWLETTNIQILDLKSNSLGSKGILAYAEAWINDKSKNK